jgi:hypothetical protein
MNVERWLRSAQFAEPGPEVRVRVLHAATVRSRLPGRLPIYSLAGIFFAVISAGAAHYISAPATPCVTCATTATSGSAPAAEPPTLHAAPVAPPRPRREDDPEEELFGATAPDEGLLVPAGSGAR